MSNGVYHPIVFIHGKTLERVVDRLLHIYEHAVKGSGGVPLPPLTYEDLAEMMIFYEYKQLSIRSLGLHVVDSHIIGRYLRSEFVKLMNDPEVEEEDEGIV